MGDWDFSGGSAGGFDEPAPPSKKPLTTGGLHIGLTLACLIAVTLVSFGVAFLMKDRVRNFWEMGLTFAAPFAALMGTALAVDAVTSKMTPNCSRKAQLAFAAGTILVAFVFGCLAEILHQPVVIYNTEPKYDYLILLDKSWSMAGDTNTTCSKAVHSLIDEMDDDCQVGIIAFDDTILDKTEVAPLDAAHRARIGKTIDTPPNGGTDISLVMNTAMDVVNKAPESTRTMRIIMITDGTTKEWESHDSFLEWATRLNSQNPEKKAVELCTIQIEFDIPPLLEDAVRVTGGKSFDHMNPSEIANELQNLQEVVTIPQPVDTLKATFEGRTANDQESNTPYAILTCALLLLLGLLTGFSLMIMFSLSGQFRVQVILSAVMGICAFLLLHFGRFLSIPNGWICEGIAFSLFGLVFMRENRTGSKKAAPAAAAAGNAPAPAPGKAGKKNTIAGTPDFPDDDF